MTKVIEDTLNLPRLKEVLDIMNKQEGDLVGPESQASSDPATTHDSLREQLANSSDLTKSLAMLTTFQEHTKKMKEISDISKRNSLDTFNLAMDVDPKHAGPLLEAAKDWMKNAIDAENSIVEKQLRKAKLDLDARRLDLKVKESTDDESVIEAENVQYLDRNELLEHWKKIEEEKKTSGEDNS